MPTPEPVPNWPLSFFPHTYNFPPLVKAPEYSSAESILIISLLGSFSFNWEKYLFLTGVLILKFFPFAFKP